MLGGIFSGQTLQVRRMYRGQTLKLIGMYRGQTLNVRRKDITCERNVQGTDITSEGKLKLAFTDSSQLWSLTASQPLRQSDNVDYRAAYFAAKNITNQFLGRPFDSVLSSSAKWLSFSLFSLPLCQAVFKKETSLKLKIYRVKVLSVSCLRIYQLFF